MANVNINAAVIESVRLEEQAGDVATPAAGYWKIYTKSGGLYLIDDAGDVIGPLRNISKDALWDAAGDLVYATAADTGARLPIGTANQVLRTNSGATAPEWASIGRVLISEQTPTGTGTVTWSSIPATYNSLVIEAVARSTNVSVTDPFNVYLNNDTTATNYRRTLFYSYGTNSSSSSGDNNAYGGLVAAANAPAGSCAMFSVHIFQYAGTTFNKQIHTRFSYREDTNSSQQNNNMGSIEWESTVAVNRIDIILVSGNYAAGTTLRLYGVF